MKRQPREVLQESYVEEEEVVEDEHENKEDEDCVMAMYDLNEEKESD